MIIFKIRNKVSRNFIFAIFVLNWGEDADGSGTIDFDEFIQGNGMINTSSITIYQTLWLEYKLYLLQIDLILFISNRFPYKWTPIIALVFLVIFSSILLASIHHVSLFISTKTGLAPK